VRIVSFPLFLFPKRKEVPGIEVPRKMKRIATRTITLAGLMAALTAAGGWLSVHLPFSPVPITGQTLFVLLSGFLLGARAGFLCQSVYVLLGVAGVPVFSGFAAGPGVLAGPTGGFLIGFIPAAFLCGLAGEKRSRASFGEVLLYCLAGTAVIHASGVAWLVAGYSMDLRGAVAAGVLPFLPGDALKAILCACLVLKLRSKAPAP
jgi:biotin transport system substrate-specific component